MTTSWIEKAIPEIFDTLSVKEMGSVPAFPMDRVIDNLKGALNVDNLSISIEKMDFVEGNTFFKGLSKKTLSTTLSLFPIDGNCFLVIGLDDAKSLVSTVEEESAGSTKMMLENESVVKGIYTYFVTEVIDSIMQTKAYGNLTMKISDTPFRELSAFCIDLLFHIENLSIPVKLLFPKDSYKKIQDHFAFIPPTLENLENIPNIRVPITIRNGSATLSRDELEDLEEGDFVILHNSFYKPSEKKGSFQMLIGNHPIFQAKIQKDGMKILDYLYFYDEEAMDENSENNPFEEVDKSPLPDDNEIDGDLLEEDILEEELENDALLSPEKTDLSGINLTMNMEIARFSLTLEELKKLSPGHKLPVPINPKQVNLVISGKSIGTGEIIEIGDTIGVKITKLY
ncbi:FliM/FliN family flagellar motor switch protein [bacterium]|nr:FliM/FliN family flagellar motor switch protein [bacterium]